MAKPNRMFDGVPGKPSVDTGGPDAIEYDLDNLFAALDPSKTYKDGSPGGIGLENIREDAYDRIVKTDESGGISVPGDVTAGNDVTAGGNANIAGDVYSKDVYATDVYASGTVYGAVDNAANLDNIPAKDYFRVMASGLKVDAYDDTGSYVFAADGFPATVADDNGTGHNSDTATMLIPYGATYVRFTVSYSWSIPTSEADSWSWSVKLYFGGVKKWETQGAGTGIGGNSGDITAITEAIPILATDWGKTKQVSIEATVAGTDVGPASVNAAVTKATFVIVFQA